MRPTENMGFFDDIPYTLQISAPAPLEVTQNHWPLSLIWVSHGSRYVANTTLQFRQVGWTEFRVGDGGVRIHIQSRKMDYETDYHAMIWDLENQVRGLTAKMVSAALEGMEPAPDRPMDLWSYWFSVLEAIWEHLARDTMHAWRTLPMHLTGEERRTHLERLKKPTPREWATCARSGDTRLRTAVRVWNPLTAERVYLLQLVQYIHRRLERILDKVPELHHHRRLDAIMHEVVVLLRRLTTEVGVERVMGEPRVPSSPLAQSHPALRRVIGWHRLFQTGLFPNGDRFFVGVKDLSLLYEYWCYLAIVRMVVEESGGTLKAHPVVSSDPVDILLSSRMENAAQVKLPSGDSVLILYERRFSALPTVAQKPDYVVELRGLGPFLIFDAKYRFELDDDYIKNYGGGEPIPPIDTINGMHQYHDAIVRSQTPYDRLVDKAIVLFPLPNRFTENWSRHRFFRSITSVGVGALPLLPGGDDRYVRDEIRRYLKLSLDLTPTPVGAVCKES
ncbi:MAG: DUF2357 domain-containing protein [Thermaerobacter sp.]|nr:DUF2357 domain-containing protein [Thermaerobacter sp.]